MPISADQLYAWGAETARRLLRNFPNVPKEDSMSQDHSNEQTAGTPTRAPRQAKRSIYATFDAAGRRLQLTLATSSSSAQALYTQGLTTRKATDEEILEIGRRGLGVVGMDQDEGKIDDGQQGLPLDTSVGQNLAAEGNPLQRDHEVASTGRFG